MKPWTWAAALFISMRDILFQRTQKFGLKNKVALPALTYSQSLTILFDSDLQFNTDTDNMHFNRIKCQTEFCRHLPFSLRLSALLPPLIPSCPSQGVVTPSLSVHLTPPFNCAAHPNALLKLFRRRGDLRSPFPCLFPECAGCRHCNGLYVLR